MVFIQMWRAYTLRSVEGTINNTDGSLSIIPKSSAAVVYTPVTRILSHWPGKTLYENNADPWWDLTGAQLVSDQDGYECLMVSNAMNGSYTQLGIWARDPAVHKYPDELDVESTVPLAPREIEYTPPRDRAAAQGETPLTWSIALKSAHLKPVELCGATGIPVRNTYSGYTVHTKQRKTYHRHAAATVVNAKNYYDATRGLPYERAVTTPDTTYLTDWPSLSTQSGKYTATYASSIHITSKSTHPVAYYCPSPYNTLPSAEHRTEYDNKFCIDVGGDTVIIFELTDTNKTPYLAIPGDSTIVSTNLQYVNNYNTVTAVMWDRPVMLGYPNIKPNATRDANYEPYVFVPVMLYHKGDETDSANTLIDKNTGRRWMHGRVMILIACDDRVKYNQVQNTEFTPRLYQLTRAITKNPVYPDENLTLKDILNR